MTTLTGERFLDVLRARGDVVPHADLLHALYGPHAPDDRSGRALVRVWAHRAAQLLGEAEELVSHYGLGYSLKRGTPQLQEDSMPIRLMLAPPAFDAAARGDRMAEHRWLQRERPFAVGEEVLIVEDLLENPGVSRILRRRVTHIDAGPAFGIRHGYGIIHLRPLEED